MPQSLTQQEQQRLAIINDTLAGKLTKTQAAMMLGISPRQVKRLKSTVRQHGL